MEYAKKKIVRDFIRCCLVLATVFISSQCFGEKNDIESLAASPESLNFMSLQSGFGSSMVAVQKRLLPKKFLSEFSFAVSPAIKGLLYLNSLSLDGSYRFYLNERWSLQAKYSYFQNIINAEGKDMIFHQSKPLLEIKHARKQSVFFGFDWYSFYGKTILFNKIIHFDVYSSVVVGAVNLLNLDKEIEQWIPSGSVSTGLVLWWNKRMNARWELGGTYYKYQFDKDINEKIQEAILHSSLSVGVIF